MDWAYYGYVSNIAIQSIEIEKLKRNKKER